MAVSGIAGAQPALTDEDALKHLGKLDIPDHGGYALFHEVLLAAVHVHGERGVQVPMCDCVMELARSLEERTAASAAKLPPPAHDVCGVRPHEKKRRRA